MDSPEAVWIWPALAGYGAGAAAAWRTRRPRTQPVLLPLLWGVLVAALAITLRWRALGYGPFLTLYEILLSNLFSLGLIYAVVYWRLPEARTGARIALPVLVLMGLWLSAVSGQPRPLPATYENPWLWVHVGLGKLFLGTALAAMGLAGDLLLRRLAPLSEADSPPTDIRTVDAWAWRLMALAFVFHSLMLIAGAVWAQDAWGRYWAWDPMETWALVTWLALGMALHLRVTIALPLWVGWWFIVGIFALAFLSFLGVPFLSLAPHKGLL